MVRILIPNETTAAERRVALTPEIVKRLCRDGLSVTVEAGAGAGAHFPDEEYTKVGAEIGTDWPALAGNADLVLKVGAATDREVGTLKEGSLLIGLLAPTDNLETVRRLAERRLDTIAMELIPRITRAQSMDVLSSQASIAGYKAVLLAASRLGKYFPLLMTAAGTVPPAKVVVMGGGVAGLQAVATARRLGAVVEVSDIREAVKEQVESLGGRFIDLPEMESGEGTGGYAREMGPEFLRRQREIVKTHIAAADVVITTAQVPGKRAPLLVSADMVEAMRPGGVIVDIAAPQGGNCELTRAGEEVTHRGVAILGPENLPSTMASDASTVYARNIYALLKEIVKDGELVIDIEDEILAGALLTFKGEVLHRPTAELLQEATV